MNSSKSISKKKAKQQHLRCNLCSKAHVFPLGVKRVFLKTKRKKQIQYIRCYLSICKQSNQHFFSLSLTPAGSAPPSGCAGELFLFDSNSLPPKCQAELTAPFQTHPFFTDYPTTAYKDGRDIWHQNAKLALYRSVSSKNWQKWL